MVKNVVFDFGQVLCRFVPEEITANICGALPAADAALLSRVVFDRLYFDRLDMGAADEEVLPAMQARLPAALWPQAARILFGWPTALPEVPGMRALLGELKAKDVGLFLLSNISVGFAAQAARIPILSYFDGCIFSGLYRTVKPGKEIFACLFRDCGIKPEESLFIDDNPENAAGAQRAGMEAFRFAGDVGAVRRFLYAKIPALAG